MITGIYKLRPRYGEVDKMGYVYHANYVSYCHQARTELMRELGIHDSELEANNIMMPVISFDIKYKKAAHYDEPITIKTVISELPKTRFSFGFEVKNGNGELLSTATSTVVFVDMETRVPMRAPEIVINKLSEVIALNNKAIISNLEPETL